jgi:hypothetical protein
MPGTSDADCRRFHTKCSDVKSEKRGLKKAVRTRRKEDVAALKKLFPNKFW